MKFNLKKMIFRAINFVVIGIFLFNNLFHDITPIQNFSQDFLKTNLRPQAVNKIPELKSNILVALENQITIGEIDLNGYSEKHLLNNIKKYFKRKKINIKIIHPDAYQVIINEASVLNTNNIEWVLRSIFGKNSMEDVRDEEIVLFFEKSEIEPTVMLYSPVLRSDNVLHPDRLKKDIPIKSGIRVFSPVVGEAIISEILKGSQGILNFQELVKEYCSSGRRLAVLGKYTGGLIPGLLLSQKMHLPFDTLTKRTFPFKEDGHKVVHVEEPHLPITSPEYYSHMIAYPNSGIIIIDDEITKGDVLINTIEALKPLNIKAETNIVILQSTMVAGSRIREGGYSYYAMKCIDFDQNCKLNEPKHLSLGRFKIASSQRLFGYSDIEYKNIPLSFYPVENKEAGKEVFFVDHPLRGMSLSLDPEFYVSVSQKIKKEIENMLGDISRIRKNYYAKGNTCYLLGITPSGLYPALGASETTRMPLIGVTNQSEPRGYTGTVIEYVTLDGYNYSIYDLEKGDGVVLITGEITDGEEQLRVIKALMDEGVNVLGVVSVVENLYYAGSILIENTTGVKVCSLEKYSCNEGLKRMNRTDMVWHALTYAVNKLERKIKDINPAADIVKIQAMPSSFTRGLMMQESDIDNMFIYVSGVSQVQLNNLTDQFIGWINVIGLLLYDTNESPPKLVSTEHLCSNEAKYGINDIPQIIIYENGKYKSRLEVAEESGNKLSMFNYEKNSARIKLLLLLGELDPLLVRALLKNEDSESFYYREVTAALQLYREKALSDSARQLIYTLDEMYLNGKNIHVFEQRYEGELESALFELCKNGLVRIYKNKIIPLWRLNSLRWTKRFWKRQIEISVKGLSKNEINAILSRVAYKVTPVIDEKIVNLQLSELIHKQSPIVIEEFIKQNFKRGKISNEFTEILIELLGYPSVFVGVAIRDVIIENQSLFLPKIKSCLLEKVNFNNIGHIFGNKQRQIHLMLNLLFDFCKEDLTVTDEVVKYIFEELLTDIETCGISERFSNQLIQEILIHMGEVFDNINNEDLKEKVFRFITRACKSYIERTRNHAFKALKMVKLKIQELQHNQFISKKHTLDIAMLKKERNRLFAEIERRRKSSYPISSIVLDYDDTIIKYVMGEKKVLNSAISFWLNFLMRHNYKEVIFTGSTYQRLFDTALNEGLDIPLESSPLLSLITENGLFYNDKQVKYIEISHDDKKMIIDFFDKKGWHKLFDGKRPGLMFAKVKIDRAGSEQIARDLKGCFKKRGINYDVTLSRLSPEGDFWAIRVYNRDKSVLFNPSTAEKNMFCNIDSTRSLVLFDDAGEFGVDRSLVESAKGALLVNVGEPINTTLNMFQMNIQNEDGARLAIEALAASLIMEKYSKGNHVNWDDMVNSIKKKTCLSQQQAENIINPVKELVESQLQPRNTIIDQNNMGSDLDIIDIYPTEACMLRCKGCPFGARHKNEYKAQVLPIETVDKLKQFNPKQIRIVGGGDPMLYNYKGRKFNDLVARIRKNLPDAEIGVCTNGVVSPSGNWQKELAWISIQLYGATKEDFLCYTGHDEFDNVIANIFDTYYENGPISKIYVNFFYSKDNILKVASLVRRIWQKWRNAISKDKELLERKHFSVQLQPYSDDRRLEDPFALSNLTESERHQYDDQLKAIEANEAELWEFIRVYAPSMIVRPFEEHFSPLVEKCSMILKSAILAADQRLYPCYIMANVEREYNFGNINQLSPEKLLEMRKQHYNRPLKRCGKGCHPSTTYTGKYIKAAGELKMQNVALTGITGDVGSGLVRYLLNKGCNVIGLLRSESVRKIQFSSNVESNNFSYSKGDMFSKEAIVKLIKGCDIIYHLAAIVGQDIKDDRNADVLAVNAFSTAYLPWLMSKSDQFSPLIYASSQKVYGIEDRDDVNAWIKNIRAEFAVVQEKIFSLESHETRKAVTEFSERMLKRYPLPKDVSIYDISKLLGERFLEDVPNAISLRISNVYGPGCYSGRLIQRLVEGRFSNTRIIEDYEERDYIYRDDLNKVLYEIGRNKILHYIDSRSKIIDVASGCKVPLDEIWRIVKKFTPREKGDLEIRPSKKRSVDLDNSQTARLLGRPFCRIETGIRNVIDDFRYNKQADSESSSGVVVFDIGGTLVRAGIFYPDGMLEVIFKGESPNYLSHNKLDGKELEQELIAFIKQKTEQAKTIAGKNGLNLDKIAVSFPGPVSDFSVVERAPTLWGEHTNKLNLAECLKNAIAGINKVYILHDISADAIRLAKEKRNEKFCVITVSSGISCRIYDKINGGLLTDKDDFAGEIGHLKVDYADDAPLCECGERGHLNAVASGRAAEKFLLRKAMQDSAGFKNSLLYQYIGGDLTKIDNKYFTEAVSMQDEWALEILAEFAKPIAYAINQINNITGVRNFYLVGGFAIANGDAYLNAVLNNLREIKLLNRPLDYFDNHIELGYSDDTDGMRGAGYFALDQDNVVNEISDSAFGAGYVKKNTDASGKMFVEALAPTALSYKNYFIKGVFEESNNTLANLCMGRKTLMVIDKIVYGIWKDKICDYIKKNKLDLSIYAISGGERVKSMNYVEKICDQAAAHGLDRKGLIVAVGGGTVMDVAGLSAQLYRRGIDYIRVPTTLLGIIDAAVGVKVGVNYKGRKNFLGAFYSPSDVISDTTFLEMLPVREMRSGIAEIIKIALISNPQLFEVLESYGEKLVRNLKFEGYDQFIEDSTIELLGHLQTDFYEHDLMRHVDFGHTFAHHFESLSNYELTHGEAVGIDILISAWIANERGILSANDFKRIVKLHKRIGLPFYHPAINLDAAWNGIQEAISHKGGSLMMVVPKRIGQTVFLDSVSREELASALEVLGSLNQEYANLDYGATFNFGYQIAEDMCKQKIICLAA